MYTPTNQNIFSPGFSFLHCVIEDIRSSIVKYDPRDSDPKIADLVSCQNNGCENKRAVYCNASIILINMGMFKCDTCSNDQDMLPYRPKINPYPLETDDIVLDMMRAIAYKPLVDGPMKC